MGQTTTTTAADTVFQPHMHVRALARAVSRLLMDGLLAAATNDRCLPAPPSLPPLPNPTYSHGPTKNENSSTSIKTPVSADFFVLLFLVLAT